jgi:5'-AMP-activated protein kinase catalytic alpha subunit
MNNSSYSSLFEFGYSYLRQLGRGGFGNIHLIYSKKYNQHFALKQSNKSSRFELINEFEILKKVSHPNIINLYSMININSNDCIVLEYCSGGNLQQLVESTGSIKGEKLNKYCFEILSAVDYLHHNKIAHRDLKPSNILLDNNDRIKLTDFGLSEENISNTHPEFCGSKMFISPEIWNQIDNYDPFLSDIYSLGILFYFISQGFLPFDSSNDEILKKLVLKGNYEFNNIDSSLELMIRQMMKLNPTERPTTFQLLSNHLFKNFRKQHSSQLSSKTKINQSIPKLKSHFVQYNSRKLHGSFQN